MPGLAAQQGASPSARRKHRKLNGVARPAPPLTARTRLRIEQSSVAHPTLPGLSERVHRVIDRIEKLGREKKFGSEPVAARRRAEAARIFLHAWEGAEAKMGGTMDFERVRAPGLPGSPPITALMDCAGYLNQARSKLYQGHYKVIEFVVCIGWSLAETARLMLDPGTLLNRDHVEFTGWRFREGLDVLADMWLGKLPEKGALRTYRPSDAVPTADAAGKMTEPARTAHASRDKVRYSDE